MTRTSNATHPEYDDTVFSDPLNREYQEDLDWYLDSVPDLQ